MSKELSNKKKLENALKIVVNALKFYADGNHYDDDRKYDYYRVLERGEIAQEALEKIEKYVNINEIMENK